MSAKFFVYQLLQRKIIFGVSASKEGVYQIFATAVLKYTEWDLEYLQWL